MKNKVLIVALNKNWTGISRLPGGLTRAGFRVFGLCPKGSYISHTKFLEDKITYPTFSYSRSKIVYGLILFSIFKFDPDLVVPGDEESLMALQKLEKLIGGIPFLEKARRVIRASLPNPQDDSLLLNKSNFVKFCSKNAVRTPKNVVVGDLEEALIKAEEFEFPLVLKFDFGYGAAGVRVCQSKEDLKVAFASLNRTGFLEKIKKFILQVFFITEQSSENHISLQQFISGAVGLAPFSAHNGQVLAYNSMYKFKTYPGSTGPTSVAKSMNHPEIEGFVRKVAEVLSYNGFGSLDFILDEKTKDVFVIELNPRPVPVCHFPGALVGNDLCEALYNELNQKPLNPVKNIKYLIALFPNEKRRDPQSPYIKEGFHDVPYEDPELLKVLDPS